jgi:hypothetical protein
MKAQIKKSNEFLIDSQISKIQSLGWIAKQNGAYLELYSEDFNNQIWEELCNNFGIHSDSKVATILYIGVK